MLAFLLVQSNWGTGDSLVAQRLGTHLPRQRTGVQSLVREDPTCCRATKPVHLSY